MNLEELKELQNKIIAKNKKINMIGLIIYLVCLAISIFILINSMEMYMFFCFMLPVTIFYVVIFLLVKTIITSSDISLFKKSYKNVFVLQSLKKYFDDLVYIPEKGFDKSFVDSVGMIDTADRFRSNDYISGIYKNIKFEQSDVHIEERHTETDSDGHTSTYWVTILKGRMLVFDFNKEFKANVQVASRFFNARRLPWGKKFHKVKMEDEEFNKLYGIFAQNEHDAFYILTPHFMEKLKDILKRLDCNMIFCFVDNRLYIAINNNTDSFEYNPLKPIDEDEIEESITNDIRVITDFVNDLSLDNSLFKQ